MVGRGLFWYFGSSNPCFYSVIQYITRDMYIQLSCTHRIMKYACNFFESCLHINISMHSQKNCSRDICMNTQCIYIEKPVIIRWVCKIHVTYENCLFYLQQSCLTIFFASRGIALLFFPQHIFILYQGRGQKIHSFIL